MSGPKDYSPPPRYSMKAFNGKLNQVFQLQSRLKMLSAEIESLKVADPELSINFDCGDGMKRLKGSNDDALTLLVFDYKGTFEQDTYDRVSFQIDAKLRNIQKQLDACEAIKLEFAGRKTDHEAYRSYVLFYENSKKHFAEFKGQVVDYLESNLREVSAELCEETVKSISAIEFEQVVEPFAFGFYSKSEREKESVIKHVSGKETAVNGVRLAVSDRVLKASATFAPAKTRGTVTGETAALMEKSRALINRLEDETARESYLESLKRLAESESLRDVYFFKELHDSILESIRVSEFKSQINRVISDLNEITPHPALEAEKQTVTHYCFNLLELPSLTNNEVDAVRLRASQLRSRSDSAFEEEEIQRKEHLFLKSQIILCLENLGYDVMDDLQVIDFEKENDFLLKIRGQTNYLNLKFKDDGSMRYVFQIPEDPQALSTDQKNLKLHEMKVTCDEFRSMLDDLGKMGLQIDLRSERPIEYDSLLSVSPGKKAKLEETKKRGKQQVRKKYLASGGSR